MSYALGPVKPWVKAAANELGPKFGISVIGGYRAFASAQDHPNGHHDGLALDFMVSNVSRGTALAEYAKANASRLGVAYIIWRQHIWNPTRASEGWRLMEDRGSTTANHYDHVHVSFNTTAPAGYKDTKTPTPAGTVLPVSTWKEKPSTPSNDAGSTSNDDAGSKSSVQNAGLVDFNPTAIAESVRKLAIVGAVLFGGVALIAVGAAVASAPARKKAMDVGLDVASVIPQTAAAATAAKAATQKG